jgi:hypothetical protein
MQSDQDRPRLDVNDARFRTHSRSLLGNAVAFALSVVLLAAAFMLSVIVFAVVASGGLLVWGYLWWRTRHLRKGMREQPPEGRVIEGEVIREPGPHDRD